MTGDAVKTAEEDEKKKGEEQNMEQGNNNMEQEIKQAEKQQYQEQVKKITPTHNMFLQMAKAFLVGGVICCIGQGILDAAKAMGADEEMAPLWCTLVLVFLRQLVIFIIRICI